ncbi:MAG: sugar phosphate isomerase/epimerase [Planctomycetes bacterium]|nr:sugar phosphate isomerase/epimerase [Planctomycetota bacterium]
MTNLSRRSLLAGATIIGLSGTQALAFADNKKPFKFMLNTSTIRGQKLPLKDQVEVAAKAGYDAIEPWISDIDQFIKDGGNLKDMGKRIKDNGLTMESAIGFFEWIVDDEEKRKQAIELAKKTMDNLAQLGGKRLAAPPTGATNKAGIDLYEAAKRYRDLLIAAGPTGVIPQVELWGFSKNLSKLGEVALVAIEAKHKDACILADVYHLFKGGSDFEGLKQLGQGALQVFHMNDYPRNLNSTEIQDKDRVYPGDGIAPLTSMLKTLRNNGFNGFLSLELFNRDYWMQDANLVAKTGLEKMKAVVEKSFS